LIVFVLACLGASVTFYLFHAIVLLLGIGGGLHWLLAANAAVCALALVASWRRANFPDAFSLALAAAVGPPLAMTVVGWITAGEFFVPAMWYFVLAGFAFAITLIIGFVLVFVRTRLLRRTSATAAA